MIAVRAGFRAFQDPRSLTEGQDAKERSSVYGHYYSYYANTIYSKRTGDSWTTYLNERGMYKHTRLIYNPVPQIVDFYVDNIWRAAANEDFESLVTPVSDGTDEKLVDAIAQLDQWGNFLAESQMIKRYAAATGMVLVEVIDDAFRQKILHKTIWPGQITDFELNSTGDLQTYTVEYPVYDRVEKRTFTYKKVVTKETYSYFKNNAPFTPEGKQASVENNDYGFCPAVLIMHSDDGGGYGVPACKDFDKVDEVNTLASHLHDNIHKTVESPVIISTKGNVISITGASNRGNSEIVDFQDPRLHWAVLKSEEGASVLDLASKLKLAEAHPFLKDLLASFHDDYPELQAATIIKENSQLSGAALERMLGPAQNRLNGVQGFYNQQLVKLRQMQLAIGGLRSKDGTWNTRTDQQAKFSQFDLNSYQDGQLDFNLKPSVLVQTTAMEDEELAKAKAERAVLMSEIVDSRETLLIAGYNDEQIDEIEKRLEEETSDPDTDPAVIDAQRLANGGTLPRRLPSSPLELNA